MNQLHIQIFETSEMSMKKFNLQYPGGGGGGKINCPGQLAPRLYNQAYGTERQSIQLNLTCIITITDATLKQVSITINTQEGGKINCPGQLAPNNLCHQSVDH